MGKPKTIDITDPEALKAAANKCFAAKQYGEAVGFYTKCIELNPNNHIYHSNRK